MPAADPDAAAAVFAALASPARVRIVNVLARSPEPVCLCDLVDPIGLAQSTVSEHLKKLVEAGLVLREERGKWSYFSLDAAALRSIGNLFALPEEDPRAAREAVVAPRR